MTTHERYIAVILLILMLAGGGFVWYKSSVERAADMAKMEATIKAEQATIDNLQKTISERDAVAKQATDALAKQQADAKTVAQQIALIESRIGLPQPVTVNIPPASQPNAPVTVSAPPADVQALTAYTTACEQCKVDNEKLKADYADLKSESLIVVKQRDAAVTAAKGGTTWHRFWKATKYIAIGGAIGAGIGYAAHR